MTAASQPEPAPLPGDDSALAFVGVSTGGSSIVRVFPRWAAILGLPTARLVGFDLPLGTSAAEYRALVARLRDDPAIAGAVVTTHKVALFAAAADQFDELDAFARLCGEISLISKHEGRLCGHAIDPISVGLGIEEMLTPDWFARHGGHVVCLGSGGAGIAISWYLAKRADAPRTITCTDIDPGRLDHLRAVHARSGLDLGRFRYELTRSPEDADRLVAAAPPGSLIVNATGLGKDRPGSPVTGAVSMPAGSVAWELNYRGPREFLEIARRASERGVRAEDGWRCFIHGWTQGISEVFGVDIDGPMLERLSEAAAGVS